MKEKKRKEKKRKEKKRKEKGVPLPGVTVTESVPEGVESWNADSGATEHVTPEAIALIDYKSIAMSPTCQLWGVTSFPHGEQREVWRTFDRLPKQGAAWPINKRHINIPPRRVWLVRGNGRYCNHTENNALFYRAYYFAVSWRFTYFTTPAKEPARDTATRLGVNLSGPWMPCVTCSKVKARHNDLPKSTDARSTLRARQFPFSSVTSLVFALGISSRTLAAVCPRRVSVVV